MRRAIVLVLLLAGGVVLASCGGKAPAPSSSSGGNVAALAEQYVDLLVKGDFQAATKSFDPTMAQAAPPDQLAAAWKSLTDGSGAFQQRLAVRTAKEKGFDCAYVTCQFANGAMDVKVVFNPQQQISGMWFVAPAK
jgi:hypothetical protein